MTLPQNETLHLGLAPEELVTSPYGRFWRPELAPLAEHIRLALLTGGLAEELLPPVGKAAMLQEAGDWPVETGFSLTADGAARVFVKTPMPGVTPAMWDWWFAWHGSEAQRYKLWHPRAHVYAGWADGRSDLTHYVGRTLHVVEYVGSPRLRLGIRFVTPGEVGLDEARLAAAGEVAICARGSLAGAPVETGWLIHHLRPVPGGCEMRSRFWIAGDNVRPKHISGGIGAAIGRTMGRLARPKAVDATDLLVRCAQEMGHLAAILPELHAAFGPDTAA